jgi:hypothetical protein
LSRSVDLALKSTISADSAGVRLSSTPSTSPWLMLLTRLVAASVGLALPLSLSLRFSTKNVVATPTATTTTAAIAAMSGRLLFFGASGGGVP